jgi:hypothetical protein
VKRKYTFMFVGFPINHFANVLRHLSYGPALRVGGEQGGPRSQQRISHSMDSMSGSGCLSLVLILILIFAGSFTVSLVRWAWHYLWPVVQRHL